MYIHLGYFIANECYYSLELRICVYPQIKENNNKKTTEKTAHRIKYYIYNTEN